MGSTTMETEFSEKRTFSVCAQDIPPGNPSLILPNSEASFQSETEKFSIHFKWSASYFGVTCGPSSNIFRLFLARDNQVLTFPFFFFFW